MDFYFFVNLFLNALSQYWFVFVFVFVVNLFRIPVVKGMLGELYVNQKLRRALDRQQYQLFKNVTLPTTDGTTQIDHILLSPFGVFVIETKNMQGWIFGSERQAKWTQQIYKHKSSFQNPLRQNYKHTETLRDLLALPLESVHSVVVFTARATFKTDMPVNVGYVNDAISFIQSHQQVCFSELQMMELAHQLSTKRLQAGLKTHLEHVKHVKDIIEDKQRSHQIKDTAVVRRICPRCDSGLVARKNRKTGEDFLGCSSYPKCRYIGH
jgi:restriction system protein